MNENYLFIEGTKVPLTDEQVAMIKGAGAQAKKTAFSRVKEDETYWIINDSCMVVEACEDRLSKDEERFECANYCTDKELLEKRALYETLNRQLWRYSMEHDGDKIDWDRDGEKCHIFYNTGSKKWLISSICHSWNFTVFFYSFEIAKNAIKEVVIPFVEENPEFYEYIYGERK